MRNHISDRIKANLVMGSIMAAVALVIWWLSRIID